MLRENITRNSFKSSLIEEKIFLDLRVIMREDYQRRKTLKRTMTNFQKKLYPIEWKKAETADYRFKSAIYEIVNNIDLCFAVPEGKVVL